MFKLSLTTLSNLTWCLLKIIEPKTFNCFLECEKNIIV